MLYVKKLNTGNLTIMNGKRRTTIRHGDLYEGEIEKIPEHFRADFVELSRDEEAKMGKSELKRMAYKFQEEHKRTSIWLNPDYKPNLGAWINVPKDRIGLKAVQYDLEQTAAEFKLDLQEKWSEWRHVLKLNPMGFDKAELTRPTGKHLESIARATGRLAHIMAELAEVERRILAVEEVFADPRKLAEKRRRFFMSGTSKMNNGKYATVDGYDIEYRDGKPFIPELGKPLKIYIEEVKIYKNTKAKAKDAVITKARKEFLDARRERRLAGKTIE